MKAAYFIAKGFSASAPEDLEHALREHYRGGVLASLRRGPFGLLFEIVGGVITPRNRVMHIRSVWIVRSSPEKWADFVTAFPHRN